jgi:hypothetical protein
MILFFPVSFTGNHLYTKGLNQFSDFDKEDFVSCEENPSTEREWIVSCVFSLQFSPLKNLSPSFILIVD